MPLLDTMPSLADLVQPYLVQPYGEHECWRLVIDLLHAGGLLPPEHGPQEALEQVREVWFQGDSRDPLTLSQPWDWWLLRRASPAVTHVGVVVDGLSLVHVSTAGVALESLRRWRSRLVQIARLRCMV